MITGDTADNVPNIKKGVTGPAFAKKALQHCKTENDLLETTELLYYRYTNCGNPELGKDCEYERNRLLLRMLRTEEEYKQIKEEYGSKDKETNAD